MTDEIPHDIEAEELIVGGLLAFPERLDALASMMPEHFYHPHCAKVFHAISELHGQGHSIDVFAVTNRSGVDGQAVATMKANAIGSPRSFQIDLVIRHYASRRLMQIGSRLANEAAVTKEPWDLADEAMTEIRGVDTPVGDVADLTLSWDEIVNHAEDMAPWVIPGLLRVDWKMILVAGEGSGKSTLMRQVGLCAANGIHPLRHGRIMPIRVVLFDFENPRMAMAETGRTIITAIERMNGGFDQESCPVYSRRAGIDLRSLPDRTIVERIIVQHRPDLVMMGPLNKMGPKYGREDHEERAGQMIDILADMAERHQFALILEAHAPNSSGGHRDMRPMGSQRWQGWPELGFGLRPNRDKTGLSVGRFRGDRVSNDWPTEILRSTPWPWTGRWTDPMDQPMMGDGNEEAF